MTENGRTQVWSCGGGVQSAAIASLIVRGRLPKPDLAVIVDTERENTSTWEYCDAVIACYLAAEHRCQLCNSDGEIHAHHRTYEHRGCELPADLIVLCDPCHSRFHDKLPKAA